jgi:phosphoglycolate phosphatase
MHLIALDLDGTLEDSRTDMALAAARVRGRLGLPARDAAALRPHVNAGMDALYRACFDDHVGRDADTSRALAAVREAYEADYLANVAVHTRLYDGIADALRSLASLGTLACVTNKPERISRALLDALGVGALFATVVGGDTCEHAKPHPVMLRTAAERTGFEPARGRAFMIGDTAGDLELARVFGATSVFCTWGYAGEAGRGRETPDLVAHAPHELPALLASHALLR